MTREEIDRILGIEGKEIWMHDYDYGEISEEENEELTRLMESLTPEDLETAYSETVSVSDLLGKGEAAV